MGTVNINGQTFSGNNIRIEGNKVLIDGVEVIRSPDIARAIEIRIVGSAMNVFTDKAVNCEDVQGDIQAGVVNCGDVGGNVQAGVINCGDVAGSVNR